MRARTAELLLVLAPTALVAAVVSSGAHPARAEIVDRIAATVNDVAIPESEVRRATAITPMPREAGESADAFRARVLDALIEEKLEYEDARRFGPAAPDASKVEAAMKRLRDRLAKEGKNPDAEFAAAGLTAEEVRATIERQLLIQRYLQERFRPVASADEERAKEEYEKYYVPERRGRGPAGRTVRDRLGTDESPLSAAHFRRRDGEVDQGAPTEGEDRDLSHRGSSPRRHAARALSNRADPCADAAVTGAYPGGQRIRRPPRT